MSNNALFINLLVVICLIIAFIKDKEKAKKSLIKAGISFVKIFPTIIIIIIFIGLFMGFISQEMISKIIGENSGPFGILIVSVFGSVLHIPSLISFPLSASLLRNGASITSVAVFITTLTMIGIVTLPLEIKELGKKFTILRNLLSFIIAIIIGILMGMIL